MVFCTGGIGKHLKRRPEVEDDIESSPEHSLGKIVEIYKLKDNMWFEYSDQLQTSRYCHSSVILGSFLYLFLGYDTEHTVFNSVGVERIEITTNEARLYQNIDVGSR